MPLEDSAHVTRSRVPPVSYISAVWLGMSPEDIAQGIADGVIDPPPGWTGETNSGHTSSSDVRTSTATGESAMLEHLRPVSNADAAPVVDRGELEDLFRAIDPTVTDAALTRIWTQSGTSDAQRASNVLGFLSRTLLGTNVAQHGSADADTVNSLQSFLAASGRRAQVVELAGKSGDELAALAKGDVGYRYALLNLDSVAIVGNGALHIADNSNGELDRFDANTGEQNFSDAWVADRAKLLAWKLETAGDGSTTISGSEAWSFIDHRSLGADGAPYQLELTTQDAPVARNTVVFGDDSATGELLKGGSGTDRIYGGGGDDVLSGNAGDDHLEGGRGDDLVMGGLGADDLAGDQGADELEGGAGNDRLRGGSDDDVLTGGRGDDRLEGGAGHDIYALDTGDGSDTIIDADSDGEIQFEGQALTGATDRQGIQWRSADGRVRYSFAGDPAEGGTLSIAFYRSGDAAADDTADNDAKVSGWHNGDLGIVLGDGSDAALAASTEAEGAADSSAADRSSAPIHDMGTSGNDGQGISWLDPVDVSAAVTTDAPESGVDNPAAHDVTDLFGQLDTTTNIASTLVTAHSLHAGLSGWAGVQEAPDISAMVSPAAAMTLGVTPHDMTSALMDFHDAGHEAPDLAATAPLANPAPNVLEVLHSGEVNVGGGQLGAAVGNMQRRGG